MRQVRPGVWLYYYDTGSDPITARRRRRSRTVHGTRDDAEKHRASTLGRLADGRYTEPGNETLEQFATRWADIVEPTLRPSTIEGYRYKLKLVNRYIGDRRIGDLTGPILTGMYRKMIDAGVARQSVVHAHRVLHRVLRDAARWKILPHNPATDADPPRVERPQMRTWTEDQVRELLKHAANDPLHPIWRLAITTGMRRGEILGLRWPAVDLSRAVLEITETRIMVNGKPTTGQPKTSASRRRVALDTETVTTLQHHHKTQTEHRELFGPDYTPGDWVFAWEDGRPYSPDWVGKQWRQLIRDTELPPIRFHDLRHTWATLALKAGVPAKVVADRLGHASITITLDTYTHHIDELDRDAAERVSELFT